MKWRNVQDFPMYIVSDTGRIRRIGSVDLAQRVVGAGYLQVVLYRNGRRFAKYVHVLVAQAFVPNERPEAIEVNHMNTLKGDCRAANLEWNTHAENMRHAAKAGCFKEHAKRLIGNQHAKGISCPLGGKSRKKKRGELLKNER